LECTNWMAEKSVFICGNQLSAIFMALVQIRDHHPGEFIYFIVKHELSEGIADADSKNLSKDTLIGIWD
jgi:hypothetical protein